MTHLNPVISFIFSFPFSKNYAYFLTFSLFSNLILENIPENLFKNTPGKTEWLNRKHSCMEIL